MTVQEAYAELISIRNHIEDGYLTHLSYDGKADKQEEYTIKAYNVAINALEKQIPKKPIFESEQTSPFGVDDVPYCPSCRCDLPEVSYCEKCGQALDWSDTDEMPNIKSKE